MGLRGISRCKQSPAPALSMSTCQEGYAWRGKFSWRTAIASTRGTGNVRSKRVVDTMRVCTCRRERRLKLRSEEHTSELQSLMRISYAVFCLKKKKIRHTQKSISLQTQTM